MDKIEIITTDVNAAYNLWAVLCYEGYNVMKPIHVRFSLRKMSFVYCFIVVAPTHSTPS